MSDIQLLFAKSLMHMKLPRTRGILSFRNFRAGDSEKITQSSTRASNNESLQTNKPRRKSNQTYLDVPDPEKERRSNSYLQNGKLNDLFTLCPSDNSRFLDSSLEKQANLLEVTASAAESSRVASLGPYTSSKIIISKLFEYFENPAKTHNLCRFSIQNDSLELLAYSVSVNGQCNQDLYQISPNKGYVPTGRSLEISVKFLGAEFDLERLTGDEIIIRSFCAGRETTRLVDFIHPKANFDSNFTAIPLKAFFRNPCEIMTSNQALSLRPVEMALENYPKALKARKRLKKLKNRGYCEKIFDRMQTVSENSQKELQKYHKQAQVMRFIFSLISYTVFLSSIGFALYYATFGSPASIKPKEPESILIRTFQSSKLWVGILTEFVVETVAGLIWNEPLLNLWQPLTQYFDT